MLKYRKKEIVIITFIVLFVLIATYKIYYKFKDSSNVEYNTDTLDVTFHEKSAGEVNIEKVSPVTDSVGLSSTAYTFTIENNTNKSLKYEINIVDNESKIKEDNCGTYQIPRNVIKFSIRNKKEKNSIYTLGNLVNGNILSRVIPAKAKEEYTMRFWVSNNSSLTTGLKLHYHGIIQVKDLGTQVAVNY